MILDKLKEILVQIITKKGQQLLKNFPNLKDSKLIQNIFEDFFPKIVENIGGGFDQLKCKIA